MFKHIVEIDGKFYLRRWTPFGWEVWDTDGYWWGIRQRKWWSGFRTADEAAAAGAVKARFVRFI